MHGQSCANCEIPPFNLLALQEILKWQLMDVLILLLIWASLTLFVPPILSLTFWGSGMHGGKDFGLGTAQMEFNLLPFNNLCHLRKVHSTWGTQPLSLLLNLLKVLNSL